MTAKQMDPNHLGHVIRDKRRERGMTQEELAYRLDVDQSTISKLERLGPGSVSKELVRLVAVALAFDPGSLETSDGE